MRMLMQLKRASVEEMPVSSGSTSASESSPGSVSTESTDALEQVRRVRREPSACALEVGGQPAVLETANTGANVIDLCWLNLC